MSDDPIMRYYEKKAADAKRLREEIRAAEQEQPRDPKKIKKLWAAVELAEYVGD